MCCFNGRLDPSILFEMQPVSLIPVASGFHIALPDVKLPSVIIACRNPSWTTPDGIVGLQHKVVETWMKGVLYETRHICEDDA